MTRSTCLGAQRLADDGPGERPTSQQPIAEQWIAESARLRPVLSGQGGRVEPP